MPSVKQKSWTFDRLGLWKSLVGRMDSRGLTLRDAAREIGIGHATLWRIESHDCEMRTVVKCCQWLGMTVDTFVEKES